MSTTYLALLRGINVGGNNIIKMESLKKTFEEMGFSAVKTYIQSGNVIFADGKNDKITGLCNKAEIAKKIEKALSKKYGYDARIVLVTFAEMRKIIAGFPAGFGDQPNEFRYDVWFLREPATSKDVMQVVKMREGVDRVFKGKKAVYTARLNVQATKSQLPKIVQTPVYQNITVRGWKVVKKLGELMEAANADASDKET
jgi:uncharacterized protein (DUF1697 family)